MEQRCFCRDRVGRVKLRHMISLGIFVTQLACTSEGQILGPHPNDGIGGASGGGMNPNSGGGSTGSGGAGGAEGGDNGGAVSGGAASGGAGGETTEEPGPSGTKVWIATGDQHSCAVVDGSLYCWGNNAEGALGLGDVSGRLNPTRVGSQTGWTIVSCGRSHSCGLLDGSVYCWGSGSNGQLGLDAFSSVLEPQEVAFSAPAIALTTGYEHSCAILADQRLYCWGSNSEGQLGQDDPFPGAGVDSPTPLEVSPGEPWSSVSGGQGHTCAIRASGTLFCWGRNTLGMLGLGNGSVGQIRIPQQVGTGTNWLEVAAGQGHTCGVQEDGALYCWGANNDNQLMMPASDPIFSPALVTELSTVKNVALNTFHTCAVLNNGQASCSGRNTEGALGNGRNESNALMASPVPDTEWSQIAAGRFHTCGVRNGKILCSGGNADGELGVGDSVRRNAFTQTMYHED